MTTGELIKAARMKAGLTQRELADKLNVSFVNISQWENGTRNPKKETLQKIANALNIPMHELDPDFSMLPGFRVNLYNYLDFSDELTPEKEAAMRGITDYTLRYSSPGYRLKLALKMKGITEQQLSKETGIAVKELNSFISDECNLPLERIYKICQALELDCGYLLTGIPTTEQDAAAAAALGTPGIIDMEQVENTLRNNLLKAFDNVNYSGKLEAVKRVQELSQLQKYKKDDNNE